MQEETDRIEMTARPELAAELHQMIVVHPDHVVVTQERRKAVGK